MLNTLLNPQSIAIVGASDDTTKPGGKILYNILRKGYEGHLMLVNPARASVQGVLAYPSIMALPRIPDVAFLAIPAKFVRQALTELARKGTKVVVVISAGFGEMSAAGKREEAELARIADEYGILLLGPNCLGVMSYAYAGKFTRFLPDMIQGGVDFISGSGASIDFLAEQAVRRGVPFNSFVTVGNSAQSDVTDILGLFDEAYAGKTSAIIILYMEVLNEPRAFLQHARRLSRQGCLLAGIKSGTTEAGSRAAASHTGAMVSNDTVIQALFDKAGVIRLHSRLELIDVASALVCVRGQLDGNRVCVFSDAGGPGVMLADELNRHGFVVPILRESTQARIAGVLPMGAGVSNPIDCLPTRTGEMIAQVFNIIQEEEADNIDYILFIMGDSGLSDIWEIYKVVGEAMNTLSIPILPAFCSVISSSPALQKFREMGKCYFEDEVSMGRALARIVNRPRVTDPETELANYDDARIRSALAGQNGPLSPRLTREVLAAAGFPFPDQQELTEKAALAHIAFPFPWVMKVMGPLHKSDVGGVRLGIRSRAEAEWVWDELLAIDGAYGCVVQRMISGIEVIMGAKREAGYGHLVAFGLGGIYTEILQDVSFHLAPLSLAEARNMIRAIKAFPLLNGVRGEPGMDVEMLTTWLLRIGRFVTDFPQVQEMDLNPVKGYGGDLYVVDARIIVS